MVLSNYCNTLASPSWETQSDRQAALKNVLLCGLILVFHGKPDVVALLPELVLDSDSVVSGIFCRQVTDGQGTVGPVTLPLQEWLKM